MTKTKGEITKAKIVETATHLFVNQGFHATTTRQITDALGLARGAIYNHFQSKDEIFEAALDNFHPWLFIPSSVQSAEGDTIEELVRDAADRMLIAWDKSPETIRLHLIELIEFQGRHLPTLFEDTFEKMSSVVRELIQERIELSSIPIATLSRALLGLFFAYLMTDRFTGVPIQSGLDQNMFEYFADAYLHGLQINKENTPGK